MAETNLKIKSLIMSLFCLGGRVVVQRMYLYEFDSYESSSCVGDDGALRCMVVEACGGVVSLTFVAIVVGFVDEDRSLER